MIFASSVLRKLVKGRGAGTTMTQIEFEAPLNSRIVALPPGAEGDTIRGLTADMLILDDIAYALALALYIMQKEPKGTLIPIR